MERYAHNMEFRYETMRPDQLLAMQQHLNAAYLPIGPLEWHGPAMPFGTDPLYARAVTERVAAKIGGVVLPTLFLGTETYRDEQLMTNLGFEDPTQYVEGQDFPGTTFPSMYAREEVFALIVREYVHMLVKQGYELIVLVNGHGAYGQVSALQRIVREESHATGRCVIVGRIFPPMDPGEEKYDGHGTGFETSTMMALTDAVDLSKLPPKGEPLIGRKLGITDGPMYAGEGDPDGIIQGDPRDEAVNDAMGWRYIEKGTAMLTEQVLAAWEALQK